MIKIMEIVEKMEQNSKITEKLNDITCPRHDIECQEKVMYHKEDKRVLFKISLCPKCNEEKKIRYEQDVKEEEDKQQRLAQDAINKNTNNAMIAPRFKDRTFDNYIATNDMQIKCVKELRDFTPLTNPTGFILLGKTGTGKNHLATATINSIVSQGYTGLFTTVVKMVRSIKDSWGTDISEQSVIDIYTKPDVLVIDELGVQFESVTEQNYLTEIINNRYEYLKPTIMLGNVTLEELKVLVGDRVMDRFREGGKLFIFDWESYRGRSTSEVTQE